MTAKPAPADVAGMIGCAPGEPSLRVQRLYFDTRETPVQLAVSYYHPERYSYRIELRRRSSHSTHNRSHPKSHGR